MSDSIIKKIYDFRQVAVPEALLHAQVTQEEINEELGHTAARFTTISAVEDNIQHGDIVALEFPDAKLPEGVRRVYVNVGKNFSDLEGNLLGLHVGDTIQIVYAGKEVAARIFSVKRLYVPTMTDDHIVRLGIENIATVAEFENRVFLQQAERQRKRKFKGIMSIVSKAVMDNTEFAPIEPDHPWFQSLYGLTMQQVESLALQQGKTVEEVLPMALRMPDKTADECRNALKEMCDNHIQQGALGQAYAKENGITFTREESISRLQGYAPQPDEMMITNDLIQRYVDYFSKVVFEYFAPKIQVTLQ